jgi:SLT domain-containing protein
MYIAKLNNSVLKSDFLQGLVMSHQILEYTINEDFDPETIVESDEKVKETLKKCSVYRYINEESEVLNLDEINLIVFKYIIGIKKTSTNLFYQVTYMDGKTILANTKSKIVTQLSNNKIDSNSVTGLNQIILSLINEIKKTLTKNSPMVLHLHNFKDYESSQIIKRLAIYNQINVQAVVLTNTNPHNGCRPSKIKTNARLNFQVPF